MNESYVYIMSNKPNGTLYIGVTSDLVKRVWQHKNNALEGFTKTYSLHSLIYFEQHNEIYQAIVREKQMKEWKRAGKINLIVKQNPGWTDLYPQLL